MLGPAWCLWARGAAGGGGNAEAGRLGMTCHTHGAKSA
jgi:hypothetical protein